MHIGVFLDRDGTIIEEIDFLSNSSDLQLIPSSAEAIRALNTLGIQTFVITNQSGIARGYFDEPKLQKIHKQLTECLRNEHAYLDAIYYCPHHIEGTIRRYRVECRCRKPKTGMLERAVRDFGIDLRKSFVIGDKMTDIQTGKNAGARSILVLTGYGNDELDRLSRNKITPDYVANDLLDAVGYIKRTILTQQPTLQ